MAVGRRLFVEGQQPGVVEALKAGRSVLNSRFDALLPPGIRRFSARHWTPVQVAKRAAELLVEDSKSMILDIGSGAGKFCIVGALTTPGQFVGVEQRSSLHRTACGIVDKFSIPRVQFLNSRMEDVDWGQFSGFYLFNPFYENIAETIRMDQAVEFSESRYKECIELVRSKLSGARPGTRVVTYYGFGGEFPRGFSLQYREPIATSALELWIKDVESLSVSVPDRWNFPRDHNGVTP